MSASATTREVTLRRRPDLVIHAHHYGHERFWVVKDPVALTYFHLRDEEHAILQMLDGRTSLQEIKRRFEETFAPLQMSFDQLQAFLGNLYRNGLVLAEVPGQGGPLFTRGRERRSRKYLQAVLGLLAIRFPGTDPDPWLCWLAPRVRWLFSRWALAVYGLLVLGAALLLLVGHEQLLARLPDFRSFFDARNVLLLAIALALIKVLHELGHAVTCKHFGGECHELGFMLLVFTPCLYCDVSDAWMLASKWKRIAISLAGVVVEIVLAAVFTFLWWLSDPGLFNTLCLNVMFICSVSTLLFNGNPLLRYDGYYVLADLIEVPNLGQQSRALVAHYLGKWFLGMPPLNDRALPDKGRWGVALYGLAASVYRVFIVLLILWFCHRVLAPYGLGVLAQLVAVVVLAGLVFTPAWNLLRLSRDPHWRGRIQVRRAVLSGCGLLAVLAAICLVPLPHRIVVPAVIDPHNARRMYVTVPGLLEDAARAGDQVVKGQLLARLVNPDLQFQVEQVRGQRDQQRIKLKNLGLRQADDPRVAARIPTAREALHDVENRLRDLEADERRLQLRAPIAGTVIPAPQRSDPFYRDNELDRWSGTPLDEDNRGCFLQTGRLVCLLGDPGRLEAMLVIDQAHLKDVLPGQHVRIRLDQLPGGVMTGRIAEVSQAPLETAPPELAFTNRVAVEMDEEGNPRPTDRCYEARVTLDHVPAGLLTGTSGHAKIFAAPRTLASRFIRWVQRTFHFEL